MKHLIDDLQKQHRQLNRRIDNCRAGSRQEDLKLLKRMRLKIKDRLAALIRTAQPSR